MVDSEKEPYSIEEVTLWVMDIHPSSPKGLELGIKRSWIPYTGAHELERLVRTKYCTSRLGHQMCTFSS